MKVGIAVSIVVAALSGADALAEPSAAGIWEWSNLDDGKPEAWVLIEEKNGVFDGRFIKLFPAEGKKQALICDKCPGVRKGARILGLKFLYGLKHDGLTYSDGHIIDIRDGTIYHFKGWLNDDGTEFTWRGNLGIFFTGPTPTWHRLSQDTISPRDIPKEVLGGASVEQSTTIPAKPL